MPDQPLLRNAAAVIDALRTVQSGSKDTAWLTPYTACSDPNVLEAVLFLKPEVTELADNPRLQNALELVANKLDDYGLSTVALVVLGADYLAEYDIIANHYGVINRISREGRDAISTQAEETLQQTLGKELEAGARVMGGHQVLAAYPGLSPYELDVLVSKADGPKLAPGTYCRKVTIDEQLVLVLNGFHPYQLEYFTRPGRAIIVAAVRGEGNWKAWRNQLIGATNPQEAAPGTLRREFLERKEHFGLAQVNQGANVVHLSAGPLEGMVEILRYFTNYDADEPLRVSATCFGQLLEQAGFDHPTIERFKANPDLINNGERSSAFDLTEETQPQEAIKLLKQSSFAAV